MRSDKPRRADGTLACAYGDCTRRRDGAGGLCGAHRRRHDLGLPMDTVARAVDSAVDGALDGPILRNILRARMDRHAATRNHANTGWKKIR
jgi:hypothetical protein